MPEIDCVTAICDSRRGSGISVQRVNEIIIMTYSVVLQGCAVFTVSKPDSSLVEFRQTTNGQVLLVGVRSAEDLLCLLDTGENVRLSILIAVSTNTKVDLARILVGLEGLSNT